MAIDQEKLKARRERQNLARKLARAAKELKPDATRDDVDNVAATFMTREWKSRAQIAELYGDSFDSPKVIAHNAELHKTSAYLAEEARATERAIDRKRWSHAL